ncbi:abc transporter b family member mitochondrial [Hordeum vulgare]|nr:abc transporter b family member mitochondrial [Hordeum vulgare]
MWSSRRSSRSRSDRERDPEHERRVWADGARKRGARRWTNRGLSPPASFNRREMEEYDCRSTSFSFARSSYAGSSSSSGAGFLPVKREWLEDEEEPEEPTPFAFVPVKEEPEEPAPLGLHGVVGPEDYVADFDTVVVAIAERSVCKEAERRRHAEELEALQWQQVVATNKKAEEWRRIRAEQAVKYVDLCSSGKED